MSKALEALERLKTAPTFMGGTVEYQTCTKSETLLLQDYETIKDYILKTQKPKQYLKWEDLDFSEELKVLKVKMNNNDYILRYALDIFCGKCCFLYDSARNHHIDLTRQFFNDLHLEVIE